MTTAIFSHPDCLKHEMGHGHPEQPDRIRVIAEALAQLGQEKDLKNYEAPKVTREQLLRVHAEDYLNEIYKIQVSPNKLVYLDPDTAMNQYTLQAAERAAGAVVAAVDVVMKKEVGSAFCNVRPPGHHAEHARAMGFCFFNNVAVGVAHVLEKYGLERVAIIDFDVHHGNGTEDIFRNDTRVLLCSSFQHPFYPFSESTSPNEHMLHLPLPAGTIGRSYINQVEKIWLPRLTQFNPQIIFFSAGFDAHTQDQLANLNFETENYARITQMIKTLADQLCEGRVISVLEGGYALEVLGICAKEHVNVL